MIGISLTAEQVRAAPPEVRHWIEQQMAGLFTAATDEQPHAESRQLAALTSAEARAVLDQIEGVLPVVSVFFELGREGSAVSVQGMRVFRLTDILRHTRLESAAQVVGCLEMINDALRGLRHDSEVMACAVDREGRCFVAEATSRAVLSLWQDIVASRALVTPPAPVAESLTPVMQAD